MKIKFKSQQYEYLASHLSEEMPDLFIKLQELKISQDLFDLDEDTMYLIREWAGEKLQRVGFDGDSRIILQRDILEELIDELYT